jgi:hypothetical protein
VNQFERPGGTDIHACLLSIGPALLAPVGRIDAQVALGGFVLEWIPDCSMRTLRTELNALFAANAFLLIDHPDIPVLRIDVRGAHRTILDAERRNTLPANGHIDVERIFGERWSITDDLNSG